MSLAKCLNSLLLAITMCCFLNINLCRANPGIRVQITKKGLDYVNELALNKMYDEMKNMHIPEQSSGSFYLYNTRVTGVSKPSGNVLLVPGQGLKWNVAIAGYTVSARLRYRIKKGWFKIQKTVSISIYIDHGSLGLTLKPAKAANGGLDLKAGHCTSDINVKASSSNFIVNIFLRLFRSKINSILEKKVCESATKVINSKVAPKVANYPVTRRINNGYFFDYSFVSNPIFTSTYMQTNHRAAILDTHQNGNFPFSAPQLPNVHESTKMIYFVISDYVLNTWLYTAHRENLLAIKVTPEKMKEGSQRDMFRTTCPGSFCVGTIFPNISKASPNSNVELDFATSKRPSVNFKPNHIQITVPVKAELIAVQSNGARVKFFTAELVLFSELKTTFADESVLFQVTNTTFTLGKVSGAAPGTFNLVQTRNFLNLVITFVETILPGQSFPLVVPSDTMLSSPTIKIVQNAIIVSSDFKITSF